MSEKDERARIKVSDRRMFTADGSLRQPAEEESQPAKPIDSPPPREPESVAEPERSVHTTLEEEHGPAARAMPGRPEFLDLVSVLAEPVAVYLGDVPLPDGQSAENLDLARYHIDLLALLKEKSEPNLTASEAALIGDLLYRLRMRYVQKRG